MALPEAITEKCTVVEQSIFVEHSSSSGHSNVKIIRESDYPNILGPNFSCAKKWWILAVIASVQISMNLNASIYGNAVQGLRLQYGASETQCRLGMAIFLISYAFGCELWAPWSEESGRKRTLQVSLGFVNLWQIPQILITALPSPESGHFAIPVIIACRFLGGLCSAGGSVTLGMVADMWSADDQQYAMAFVVLSSVMGSIVGPIVGGYLESFASTTWIFLAQLILGLAVQLVHAFSVPETRSSVLLTRKAKELRKIGKNVRSQAELNHVPFRSWRGLRRAGELWARPFVMFVTEPIVLCLSLISGFSDALIFTFLESLPMAMSLWGFKPWQMGLCFVPIGIGYVLAWAFWVIVIYRRNQVKACGVELDPESRLKWLLWMAPLLPIGIFPFAWTGTGPPTFWSVPLMFLIFIGMANYAIYGATVDYMVAAYGEKFSASATGGNGFARDLLAGVSAFYTKTLYTRVGPSGKHLQLGSTLLGCFAVPLIIPIYFFYWRGLWVRGRSKFAKEVEEERQAREEAAMQAGEV